MQLFSQGKISEFKKYIDKQDVNLDKFYSFWGKGQSLALGLLMAIYIVLIQNFLPETYLPYLNPLKYLLMFGVFSFTFISYKQALPGGKIFRKGGMLGLTMSAITAVTMVFSLAIFQFLFDNLRFYEFSQTINTYSEYIVYDWILLLETFVSGVIITFILLQGLKNPQVK